MTNATTDPTASDGVVSDKAETPSEPAAGVPYGYGHPAHRPDPDARYEFKPEISRVLPVNAKIRWR